ncbi:MULTISPECIES: hypothetical protein [unclassified Kitasatospora]|uniref:hypothetical protein n=1 Tax=unclassified Kitasatospora TaxID=2633591 RepID=UPI0034002345
MPGGDHPVTAVASDSGGSSAPSAVVNLPVDSHIGSEAVMTTGSRQDFFGRGSDGHLHHWFWNPALGGGNWQTQDWGGDLTS